MPAGTGSRYSPPFCVVVVRVGVTAPGAVAATQIPAMPAPLTVSDTVPTIWSGTMAAFAVAGSDVAASSAIGTINRRIRIPAPSSMCG